MQNKNELEEKALAQVTGGEIESSNVVRYQSAPVKRPVQVITAGTPKPYIYPNVYNAGAMTELKDDEIQQVTGGIIPIIHSTEPDQENTENPMKPGTGSI